MPDERTDNLLRLADQLGSRRARETEAIGRRTARQFRQVLGERIGALNRFSGLRTGRTEATLGRLQEQFTGQIGEFALEASGRGIEDALRARELFFREEEAERSRRSSLFGDIGKILARGAFGFATGGPAGAGAAILGGAISSGGDEKEREPSFSKGTK